jgi:diaminopimelate epimerase
VDMGEPILEAGKIPVELFGIAPDQKVVDVYLGPTLASEMDDMLESHRVELGLAQITCVSMGNPHAIIYCSAQFVNLERFGPFFETHSAFPKRINVHFVKVHSPQEVTMRTWERGSGITLACGTGAAAVCVAGVLTGRTERKILAHLLGGDLELEWNETDNHVYMTGPATEVFSGQWAE